MDSRSLFVGNFGDTVAITSFITDAMIIYYLTYFPDSLPNWLIMNSSWAWCTSIFRETDGDINFGRWQRRQSLHSTTRSSHALTGVKSDSIFIQVPKMERLTITKLRIPKIWIELRYQSRVTRNLRKKVLIQPNEWGSMTDEARRLPTKKNPTYEDEGNQSFSLFGFYSLVGSCREWSASRSKWFFSEKFELPYPMD